MIANAPLSSDFLNYLVSTTSQEYGEPGNFQSLPSLNELSKTLGVSIASLREQVEVAEALGLVDVRPRTGIRRLPYSFFPAVNQSLSYAIHLDRKFFDLFSEFRHHIETAFWDQAVRLLTAEDHQTLTALLTQAMDKLYGSPTQIPHAEHRQLHLTIYCRLDNPFVLGILEAYWEAYESVGLSVYADFDYLREVWNYHKTMVEAIHKGDYDAGYQALVEHIDLLYQRADPKSTGMARP